MSFQQELIKEIAATEKRLASLKALLVDEKSIPITPATKITTTKTATATAPVASKRKSKAITPTIYTPKAGSDGDKILKAVNKGKELSMSDLTKLLGKKQANFYMALTKLVEAGLVVKTDDKKYKKA